MVEKPKDISGYGSEFTDIVRRTCLTVAVHLQDYMENMVIAGGLVPTLLIDNLQDSDDFEAHAGTRDLDIGLSLAILDEQLYQSISERIRALGFEPEALEVGTRRRQRWHLPGQPEFTGIDFLIPMTNQETRGGRLQNLESDFAAILTPGLHHAFRDKVALILTGTTLAGDMAERQVHVAGPGAFTVLKALAFGNRGEPKDAYDLWYLLRFCEESPAEIAGRINQLERDAPIIEAVNVLKRDFTDMDAVGIKSAARFLHRDHDDELKADFRGFVLELLAHLS